MEEVCGSVWHCAHGIDVVPAHLLVTWCSGGDPSLLGLVVDGGVHADT